MSARWKPVTRNQPCEICGATDWCTRDQNDPDTVTCFRVDAAPPGWHRRKTNENAPGGVFRRGDRPEPKAKKGIAGAWEKARSKLTDERAAELAALVGLPVVACREVGCGWLNEWRTKEGRTKVGDVFALPAKNHRGQVIGLSLRTRAGQKWAQGGGSAGLFYPTDLATLPDPVLIVEGWSDTAALRAIGVAAIGRWSTLSGLDHIVPLVRGRETIIVGEHDPKPNGDWPGRDHAREFARRLAVLLQAPTSWAMTPDGIKDTRAWISPRLQDTTPEAIREQLLERLTKRGHLHTLQPDQLPRATNRDVLANVVDTDGAQRVKPMAIPMPQIARALHKITGGWPRRVNGLLFSARAEPRPKHGVPTDDDWRALNKSSHLFGYIHELADVRWSGEESVDPLTHEIRTPPTKDEFYSSLTATAMPNYRSIELMPHEPPIDGSFYLPFDLPESDGTALLELLSLFNPETELDRDLMLACVLTPGWGGPPGRRPSFVFTSDYGTGSGKTATASLIADIWGGAVSIEEREDWNQARSRLLDDEALSKRCVIIDNVKGRLAGSGLESAVTDKVLSGKRMYKGEFRRPNYLTWLVTANTPQLSQDLTTRSVVIKVGKPKHGSDFERRSHKLLTERRAHVIADVVARLSAPPESRIPTEKKDRWGSWLDGVLSCFHNGEELTDYIQSGRPAVNQDYQDACEVQRVIHSIASRMGLSAESCCIQIPKKDLRDWLASEGVISPTKATKGATLWLDQIRALEPLHSLQHDPRHGDTRCWIWQPLAADGTPMHDGTVYRYEPEKWGPDVAASGHDEYGPRWASAGAGTPLFQQKDESDEPQE